MPVCSNERGESGVRKVEVADDEPLDVVEDIARLALDHPSDTCDGGIVVLGYAFDHVAVVFFELLNGPSRIMRIQLVLFMNQETEEVVPHMFRVREAVEEVVLTGSQEQTLVVNCFGKVEDYSLEDFFAGHAPPVSADAAEVEEILHIEDSFFVAVFIELCRGVYAEFHLEGDVDEICRHYCGIYVVRQMKVLEV